MSMILTFVLFASLTAVDVTPATAEVVTPPAQTETVQAGAEAATEESCVEPLVQTHPLLTDASAKGTEGTCSWEPCEQTWIECRADCNGIGWPEKKECLEDCGDEARACCIQQNCNEDCYLDGTMS